LFHRKYIILVKIRAYLVWFGLVNYVGSNGHILLFIIYYYRIGDWIIERKKKGRGVREGGER